MYEFPTTKGTKNFSLSRFVQLKSFMKNSQELSESILLEPCRADDVLITFFNPSLPFACYESFFFPSFYLFIPF